MKDPSGSMPLADSNHRGLYEGWQALGLMLEGCVQSGRWQALHALIQRGRRLLDEGNGLVGRSKDEEKQDGAEREYEDRQGQQLESKSKSDKEIRDHEPFTGAFNTLAGTERLVKGMVSAADRHLALLMSDTDQTGLEGRRRHSYWPVIQHIRLELPGQTDSRHRHNMSNSLEW